MGGRQTRTDPLYGHIFDHFAVEYEYADGRRVLSLCRQQDGTTSKRGRVVPGVARAQSNAYDTIEGRNAYNTRDPRGMNPYVEEHRDLVASIRAGKPLNEGRQIVESNLTAILGRERRIRARSLTWDELLASNLSILPTTFALGATGDTGRADSRRDDTDSAPSARGGEMERREFVSALGSGRDGMEVEG
jgi:myo-inositol 2-dehydrogenase/D-chiro-inositol 1-dehydrogenase